MTINQRNCGSDSRMVKALLEQVSGLQEDVAVLDSQIDDLSGTKANKADIAEEVTTKKLTADTATVGEGTVSRLHSSEVDTNSLHATETLTNRLEVNGSADIASLSADASTVKDLVATNLNAARMKATEKIEVGEGVQADVVLDRDTIKAPNVVANKVVAKVSEVTNVKSENTVTDNLEVTGKTTVKDLDITGEITGLNNVDINAQSIDTPVLDADSITTGGIVTSDVNHLIPSPHLDNNDHYTIVLPTFTGTMVLKWADKGGNEVWSATVIGNGSDYSIHWGTKAESLTVTKLYQYRKHLYIRENANGSLYYSYHTTEEIEAPSVLYNYTGLGSVLTENYQYDATVLSGTYAFGKFYAPSMVQTGLFNLDDVEINKLKVAFQLEITPPIITWADQDVKVCDSFTTDWIRK